MVRRKIAAMWRRKDRSLTQRAKVGGDADACRAFDQIGSARQGLDMLVQKVDR